MVGGLIAINGHLGSSRPCLVKFHRTDDEEHWQAAVDEARWHADTFGVNVRGTLLLHRTAAGGVKDQDDINPLLIRLARELDLPLVCDNDVHFLNADDYDVHDTLCCISMQKNKDDDSRLHYPTDLYLKSPEEMAELFDDLPEAIESARNIGARCNVELDFDSSHVPLVRVEGPTETPYSGGDLTETSDHRSKFELAPFDAVHAKDITVDDVERECDALPQSLCEAGLIRYGPEGVTEEIRERRNRELRILVDKHISAYFLICATSSTGHGSRGIPANARGSGVGTMVGYILGLSNACPPRSTDPDRSEYPDIDIDICQDGRTDVINYVRESMATSPRSSRSVA